MEPRFCQYCGTPLEKGCDCVDGYDSRFPSSYAEIEYSDFDSPDAVSGARFDDMNFFHYFER